MLLWLESVSPGRKGQGTDGGGRGQSLDDAGRLGPWPGCPPEVMVRNWDFVLTAIKGH